MTEASPTPVSETAPEEWRAVVGYEGLYEVSSLGRVQRIRWRSRTSDKPMVLPKQISTRPNVHGYPSACLCKDNRAVTVRVHKLVAEAYIGPRPEGLVIAHLDGDQTNNRPENLAYVTQLENNRHKVFHGTVPFGERNGFAKLTNAEVAEMRELRARFGHRLTFKMLGSLFDVSETHARNICGEKHRSQG